MVVLWVKDLLMLPPRDLLRAAHGKKREKMVIEEITFVSCRITLWFFLH